MSAMDGRVEEMLLAVVWKLGEGAVFFLKSICKYLTRFALPRYVDFFI